MKEIYIIWNNSFEYGDMYTDSTIAYITEDYNLAEKEFEQYKELCRIAYDDQKWCYDYSLFSYPLDTYPIKGKCLCKINNIPDD